MPFHKSSSNIASMKPDINLENPLVEMVVGKYYQQMCRALSIPQTVESAVIPIFHTIQRKTKPDQIGSGVVVEIKNEYFIFSASHVFDAIGSYNLLVGTCNYERLTPLSGERFSTPKGKSGSHSDDPLDASVFHIQDGLTDTLKNIAITLDDLDIESINDSNSVFMAAGFRTRKSNTSGNEAKGKRECFPSIEYGDEEYKILQIDRNIHIALAFEDQVLVNGRWQTSPTPKGFSGGALMKACGLDMKPPFSNNTDAKQKLTAITIEQRREKHGKPGVIIGTRVGLHLELIRKFLPELSL